MKTNSPPNLLGLASCILMISCQVKAADYWWDSNGTTAGFGSTTGTWGTSDFWSDSSAGTNPPAAAVTNSSDTVNFGTSTLNYANAAVGIAAGGVTVNSIIYGSGQSTSINIGSAGNSITLAGSTPVITVNRGGVGTPQTISSNILGSAGLNKTGNGLLVLSGTNSYTGGTNINAGLVRFTSSAAMTSGGGIIAVGNGAGLVVDVGAGSGRFTNATSGAGSFGGILAGVGSGGNTITYSGDVTVGLDLNASGTAFTYSGVIANPTGSTSLSLLKLNGQNLTLTGANTYSGKTILHGGTIVVTSIGNVGDASSPLGTNSTIEFLSSGNLTFSGTTAQSSNKILNIAEGGATIRADGTGAGAIDFTANINPTSTTNKTLSLFGGNTNANTISGNISNGAGGVLSILKNLPGKWILSGANTYTGTTTVSNGTLLVNNTTGSGTGTGNVSVTLGTLGGTGLVTGNVIIGNNSGTADAVLAPGIAIGAISTGNLTFNSDASFACEVDASSLTSDRANVTGTVTIHSSTTLSVSLTGSIGGGRKHFIVANDGVDPVIGTFAGFPQDAVVGAYGGTDLKISYTGDSASSATIGGNDIVLYTDTSGSAYDIWAAANAPSAGPDDDFDGDGVSNAVEFVLGGLATTNDLDKLPAASATGGNFTFTFKRDVDSIDPKTALYIETSTDLATWNTAPSPYTVPDGAVVNNPGVTVVEDTPAGFDTVTLTVPQPSSNRRFARLKVVITP